MAITNAFINTPFVKVATRSLLFNYSGSASGKAAQEADDLNWSLKADESGEGVKYTTLYQNSVVFIEDSQDIWAQGIFFHSFSGADEDALAQILANYNTNINALKNFVDNFSIDLAESAEKAEYTPNSVKVITSVESTYNSGAYSYSYAITYQSGGLVVLGSSTADSAATLSDVITNLATDEDGKITYAVASISSDKIEAVAHATSDENYDGIALTGSTVDAQLVELAEAIAQATGTANVAFNDMTGSKGNDKTYFVSDVSHHGTYIDITYGSELPAGQITVTYTNALGDYLNINTDTDVQTALNGIAAKLNSDVDQHLASVRKANFTEGTTPTDTAWTEITDDSLKTPDNLFVEFQVTTEEGTANYFYVSPKDLVESEYKGAVGSQITTYVNHATQTISAYVESIGASYITDLTAQSGAAYVTTIEATDTVQDAIAALNYDTQTKIQSLTTGTLVGVNVDNAASNATITNNVAYISLSSDESSTSTGYTQFAAGNYADTVGYLNDGIKTAYDGAYAYTQETYNLSIAYTEQAYIDANAYTVSYVTEALQWAIITA